MSHFKCSFVTLNCATDKVDRLFCVSFLGLASVILQVTSLAFGQLCSTSTHFQGHNLETYGSVFHINPKVSIMEQRQNKEPLRHVHV